jgi:serine/threonine-protein kinase
MLTNTGQIKVMDFGIARPMDTSQATMTQTAAVIGTAQYLSPEQARGETVDARSDIYSVGCMLYELLTGRPPFIGESPVVVAVMHVRENPVPPSQLDPEITGQMDALVLTALAKDPGDRYQSAQEMRDDIARLLHGQQIEATVPVAVPPVAPPAATGTRVLSPTMAASLDESGARRLLDTETGIGGAFAEEDEDDAPPPVDPNRKKTISRVAIILVSLLVVVGAVIGFIIYRAMQPQEIPQLTVPSVLGMTQDDAVAKLKQAELQSEVTTQQVDDKEQSGKVIDQDPKGDTQVPPGSKVKIVIAIGPDSAEIPTLTGKTEYEAKQILEDAGWKKTKTADAIDEPITMKEGQVVGTNPEAGQKVSFDQEITINVATGQSKVPDVRNQSQSDAMQIALEHGFSIDTGASTFENSDSVPNNYVIDQSPAPGEMRYRETTITIVVSMGPKVTPTPPPDSPSASPSASPSVKPDNPDNNQGGNNGAGTGGNNDAGTGDKPA